MGSDSWMAWMEHPRGTWHAAILLPWRICHISRRPLRGALISRYRHAPLDTHAQEAAR